MKFEEFVANVVNWAKVRGIFAESKPALQLKKTLEEVEELQEAIEKNDIESVRDGIGDVVVTLVIQAHMNNLDFVGCCEHAWNQIKDRKGVMSGGVFVKEEDIDLDKFEEDMLEEE